MSHLWHTDWHTDTQWKVEQYSDLVESAKDQWNFLELVLTCISLHICRKTQWMVVRARWQVRHMLQIGGVAGMPIFWPQCNAAACSLKEWWKMRDVGLAGRGEHAKCRRKGGDRRNNRHQSGSSGGAPGRTLSPESLDTAAGLCWLFLQPPVNIGRMEWNECTWQ